MSKESLISIRFIFQDRKFEVAINPEETLLTLKSIVKETLWKRINLKKFKLNIKDLTEKNITIQKPSVPVLYDSQYDNKTLIDLGIVDNDDLMITLKFPDEFLELDKKEEKEQKSSEVDLSKYSVYRKIIPGDHSCLFNAINYALNQCLTEANILRELISVEIMNNPSAYNEAVLDAKPEDYCEWIMRDDSWGGGIELSILSKFFQIRIDVVDILNSTIEIIGDVKYFLF